MKVDIIKPQVDRFVFPVAHDVIVPAGRPSSKFGLRLWPSVLRYVVFLHSPGASILRCRSFLQSVLSSPSLAQEQADCFGVKVEGAFQGWHCRY